MGQAGEPEGGEEGGETGETDNVDDTAGGGSVKCAHYSLKGTGERTDLHTWTLVFVPPALQMRWTWSRLSLRMAVFDKGARLVIRRESWFGFETSALKRIVRG